MQLTIHNFGAVKLDGGIVETDFSLFLGNSEGNVETEGEREG